MRWSNSCLNVDMDAGHGIGNHVHWCNIEVGVYLYIAVGVHTKRTIQQFCCVYGYLKDCPFIWCVAFMV